MQAIWNNKVIAESNETIVTEGNHYFPVESVNKNYLVESEHTSFCPWKGKASYFSLLVDGKLNTNAVWYYPETKDAAKEIEGRLAFWNGVTVK
jgi:uncharacterized protein (DUF427 family)